MKSEKLFITLLAIISLMLVGCAKTTEVGEAKDKAAMEKAIEANMSNVLQSTASENTNETAASLGASTASADTKDMVVGVWRAEHPVQGVPGMCVSEWIYQSNGAYSGMTQCGPYAMQRTGTWSLPDNNTIRVSLKDGKLIRWDSWKFRMLDRNRMALGDGRLIAYRAN